MFKKPNSDLFLPYLQQALFLAALAILPTVGVAALLAAKGFRLEAGCAENLAYYVTRAVGIKIADPSKLRSVVECGPLNYPKGKIQFADWLKK